MSHRSLSVSLLSILAKLAAPFAPAIMACAALVACDDGAPPEPSSYEICIHSNAAGSDGAGVLAGHAWLTLHDGTSGAMLASYGLWPDGHPGIQAAGLDNGDGSDVRTNFSGDMRLGTYYYCRCITKEQKAKLDELVTTTRGWCTTDNCSSFASDTFYEVTGVDVDADDEGALGVETPREVGDSIKELNGGSNTPSGAGRTDDGSSTSSAK